MDGVAKTLFDPFKPVPEGMSLFLNARAYNGLPKSMTLQQGFKPFVRELAEKGFFSTPEFPDDLFMCAYVLLPKNMVEARYIVARALQNLQQNGVIAIAAANDAGGKRVGKILEEFGVANIQEHAANKARVAWGVKTMLNQKVHEALQEGAARFVTETDFISQPGVFAWDKIDKGSALLAECLGELKGVGADFGCGYGFLSQHILDKNPNIIDLCCIDADIRAVKLCEENLKGRDSARKTFLWADLTQPLDLKNLDFIVMNPPFHEGKKTDADIGRQFIRTALESLRRGGQLWLVANASLPYESLLDNEFSQCKKIAEKQGFKVYCAVK